MKDAGFIKALEEKGYKAYYVGGCVRDSLLGLTPTDFDITTSALPEEIMSTFPFSSSLTGDRYGTVTVKLNEYKAEITTMREEGDYTDSRHPDKVIFTDDIYTDLRRRDFTVNAIAWNKKDGLIDPYNGIADIKSLTLRTVGEPAVRFAEDPLRILRGWRFCTNIGFKMDEATLSAALSLWHLTEQINPQTVRREIDGILSSDTPEILLFACGKTLPGFGMSRLAVESILASDGMLRYEHSKRKNDIFLNIDSLSREKADAEKQMKLLLYKYGTEVVSAAAEVKRYTYGDMSMQTLLNRVLSSDEPYNTSHLSVERKLIFDRFKDKTGEMLHLLTLAVIEEPSLNSPEKLIKTAILLNTKSGRPS